MARLFTVASLVLMDAAVNHYQTRVNQILPDAEVLILDAAQDGIEQITAALATRNGIQNLHIVSQGNSTSLQLGSTHLTLFNLDRYGWQLQQWGETLAVNATVFLHGCRLEMSETIQSANPFLTRLCLLIGADVVASNILLSEANLEGSEREKSVGDGAMLFG